MPPDLMLEETQVELKEPAESVIDWSSLVLDIASGAGWLTEVMKMSPFILLRSSGKYLSSGPDLCASTRLSAIYMACT